MPDEKNELATQMAVIQTHVEYIKEGMDEIKEVIKDVPQIKIDITDYKFWKNKILIGVLTALIASAVGAILKVAYGI